MANGDGGVGPCLPLHQQRRQGLAHYLAAAANHHVTPGRVVPVPYQQLLNPRRGAGYEGGAPLQQLPGVERMDAVHVLPRVQRFDHRVLVNLVRQRKLDQDAVKP